jgi:hypothetical protein
LTRTRDRAEDGSRLINDPPRELPTCLAMQIRGTPCCTGEASAVGGAHTDRVRAGGGKGVVSAVELTLRAGFLPPSPGLPMRGAWGE